MKTKLLLKLLLLLLWLITGSMHLHAQQQNSWEFDDPANPGLNLDKTAGDASFENGMLKMTITEGLPWQEPAVWSDSMDVWTLGDAKYFWMRIKNESEGNDVGFTALAGSNWYGLNRVKIATGDSIFRHVLIDLTVPSNWWSSIPETLNEIRFDGPKGVDAGVYYVDFYRFVEDLPVPVKDVAITAPFNTAYGMDHIIQLQAVPVFEDSIIAYLSSNITWSVSDESIATISEDGKLTPVSGGEVTVYAASDLDPDVKGSFVVNVLDSYEPPYAWEFDDPENTGLNPDKAAGEDSVYNDMLHMTIIPNLPWQEPVVWSEYIDYWTPGNKKYFWMSIKNESEGNHVGFTAIGGNNWYGLNRVNIPTQDSVFREVIIDLSDPANWWSSFPEYLNEIRFDGPKGVDTGKYTVDYYRFVEDFPYPDSIEEVKITSRFDKAFGLDHNVQFNAEVIFKDRIVAYINPGINWSVSDENVATISKEGLLSPVSAGQVKVYAYSEIDPSVKDSFTVDILESYEIQTSWEFDDSENTGLNLDKTVDAIASVEDGFLKMIIEPTTDWKEPNVYSDSLEYWTFGDLKYLWVRMKNESEGQGIRLITLTYNENGAIDWQGTNRLPVTQNDTAFQDYLLDLSNPDIWWGSIPEYINEFRFDGPNGADTGVFYVDFYRFLEELPPVDSIIVSSPYDEVYGIGSKVKMNASAFPTVASQEVTWSVDDEAIAVIDPNTGILTAVSAGEVIVTATAADGTGVTKTSTITVFEESMPVSTINLYGEDNRTVAFTGSSLQILTEILPLNATDQTVTFTVDNDGVATIDAETGLLSALTTGTVVVTATAQDGSAVTGTVSIEVMEQTVAWTFDDASDWDVDNAVNANAMVQNGMLVVEVTGENSSVPGEEFDYWQVLDLKWLELSLMNGSGADKGILTAILQDGTESSIYFPLEPSDDQYRNIAVNLTGVPGWDAATVIKQFRLDIPNAATGTITIDHIQFLKERPVLVLSTVTSETTILEFENFNDGGEGVGYVDKDAGNNGGGYRPDEDVDIGGGEGRYNVGWTDVGDMLHYDIEVIEAGLYNVTFNFATIHGWYNEKFNILINGSPVLTGITLPAPEDFVAYSLDTSLNLSLGLQTLTFVVTDAAGGFDLNNLVFQYDGYLGNNDAAITSIELNGAPMEGFDPGRMQYRVELADISNVNVSATPSDPNAQVDVVTEGNTVTITCTAEDGITVKTYTLKLIQSTTGILNTDNMNLNVYPNPAKDRLYITGAENAVIRIISIDGRIMANKFSVDQKLTIDVSSFEKGIYILSVTRDNINSMLRFSVQ